MKRADPQCLPMNRDVRKAGNPARPAGNVKAPCFVFNDVGSLQKWFGPSRI